MEMDRGDSDPSDDDYEEDGGGGSGAEGEVAEAGARASHRRADNNPDNDQADSEGELYDIALAASHSSVIPIVYIVHECRNGHGPWTVSAGGRLGGSSASDRSSRLRVPRETVPMLMPHASDAALLAQAIKQDKLFGLLCPDESGTVVSGYGVLCEVFEAGMEEEVGEAATFTTFKARAIHRFRFTIMPKISVPIAAFNRMHFVEVMVLPELSTCDSLSAMRLHSLAPLRDNRNTGRGVVRLEASTTPWPTFVHHIFDYQRMRKTLQDYFKTIMLDNMPEDPVSLSFWVASNMALSARDRLALFVVDNALLRLHMECRFAKRKSVLCCSSCLTEIARKENIFPMSSEGVHANYVNLGGYMHDLLTVSRTSNTSMNGSPTEEYSWFPGYAWTISTCAHCQAHVGWRFVAMKSTLRPQQFYGLCRNYVQPCTRRRDLRDHSPY